MRRVVVFLSALAIVAAASAARASSDYAVVVSKKTLADSGWKEVVDALKAKHKAEVITYDKDVNESLEALKKQFPTFACFVAQPDESGRAFVEKVHKLTRKLDDDPYTDVRWGIITGYNAKNALRIAKNGKPLIIRKGAAGCGLNLNAFDAGYWFGEGSKEDYGVKKLGGEPENKKDGGHTAEMLVDVFNNFQPDFFGTSGHATHRDWQIGYPNHEGRNYKGEFRSLNGILFAIDRKGDYHPIDSPNPKVYLPWGNCLMGLIKNKQSICLGFMGSGGVDQMFGYTVPTWYGRAGWGTREFFFNEQGTYSLTDAFYFNNQSIVHDIATRFPKSLDQSYDKWDIEKDQMIISRMAMKLGYTKEEPGLKDNLGLLWDRDTLAFYGDPAWDARMAPRDVPFTKELKKSTDGGTTTYTFRIKAKENCDIGRTAMFLPKRAKSVEVVKEGGVKPLVTTKFILLEKVGKIEKGKSVEVVFKAT